MRFSARTLTYSTVTLLLSSCAYVIPPAQNAPRNNEVRGDMHRPQLNSVRPQSANTPAVSAQPMAQAPALPPVDAQTKAVAEATLPPASPMGERRVPLENQPFETASMGYEPIMNVPPRPAVKGPESTRDQLQSTQYELEQGRANAAAQRDALARDAAVEPSMLSNLPSVQPTPAAGVNAAPLAPLPSEALPPRVTVPVPAEIRRAPVATQPTSAITPPPTAAMMAESTLPPEPVFAPPVPLTAMQPVAAARSAPEITAAALPAAKPAAPKGDFDPLAAADLAPSAGPTVVAAAPVPVVPATAPAAKPAGSKGDFDPLAAADNAPVVTPQAVPMTVAPGGARYAASGLMAPSRYYTRRY